MDETIEKIRKMEIPEKLTRREQSYLASMLGDKVLKTALNKWMTSYDAWKWIALIILGTVNSIGFWIFIY